MATNDLDKPALRGRKLTPGHAQYDAAARKELDRRTAQLRRLRATTDEAYWRQAQHYLVIRDRKLYIQDGCASLKQWLDTKHKRGRTAVYEMLKFAEHFSLADVRRYTKDMLDQLLEYVALTLAPDEEWVPERVVLTVPRDGLIVEVPFPDCDPVDLEAALAHQRKLAFDRALNALTEEQREGVAQLVQALSLPGDDRTLATVGLRPAASGLDEDNEVNLRFRWGDLRSVVERLAAGLLAEPRRGRRNH